MSDPAEPLPGHYYRRIDQTHWEPTERVQGAWLAEEQHMAPVGGLIAHALDSFRPRADLRLARLSFDILGVMRRQTTEIVCRVARPGRTVELVEATMSVAGRVVVRATGWRLLAADTTALAGGAPDPMPGPDTVPAWDGMTGWPGHYVASVEYRVLPGGRPGRRRAWLHTDVALLDPAAGRPAGGLAEYVKLVDTANGIAPLAVNRDWAFPNTDLQIHLWRSPRPGWVGLDVTQTIGPDGVGLTATVLHDLDGPVGRATQILTVRPLPAAAQAR